MNRQELLSSPARLALLLALASLPLFASLAATEPAYRQKFRPLESWIELVDDPATADSAYAGVLETLPSLGDSAQRGFAWYLLYSAAQARGRVDTMIVAAESCFAMGPTDPSALRELASFLGRRELRLDVAERVSMRAIEATLRGPHRLNLVQDLAWLGQIRDQRGNLDGAMEAWERCEAEAKGSYPYVFFALADGHVRRGEGARALERYAVGLATWPRSEGLVAEGEGRLDSLAAALGFSRDSLRADVAQRLERSRAAFYLDNFRDDRRVPARRMTDLESARSVVAPGGSGLTVAYFWTTWCGPCRASLPELQKWSRESRTKPVRVVAVSGDQEATPAATRERVTAFVRERQLGLPVVIADSVAVAAWKVRAYPTTFVVRDGRIVYRNHGGALIEGLEAQLESLGSRRREVAAATKRRE